MAKRIKKEVRTIADDIKELHNLIIDRQVSGTQDNTERINELQSKVDFFYYGTL